MRAAYCISGYTGGLAGRNVDRDPADYRFCHSINYQNVILPNRCDVFFHTWSTSEESKLVDLYRPISYICEDQIYPDTWPDAKTNAREFRWTSRWYGFNRAVSLMKAHEQANGFIVLSQKTPPLVGGDE